MSEYICKIADLDEIIKKWDYKILIHPNDESWIIWKNKSIEGHNDNNQLYGASLTSVGKLLEKFCRDVDGNAFIYNFFPFIYGIYPYAVVTEKQKEAMEQAEIDYQYHTIYELAYGCALKLLED